MRPRDRSPSAAAPPESSPSAAGTLTLIRPSVNLSSMVVRPPTSSNAPDDDDNAVPSPTEHEGSGERGRELDVSESHHQRRRRESPVALVRRGESPDLRRRRSSPDFRPRGGAGYAISAGSLSPPRRNRPDDDLYFGSSAGQRYGRGFQGMRESDRSRDISPNYGRGRGGRSLGRGYNGTGRGYNGTGRGTSYDGEYVHRNDPNLSPREGDWICRNPSCGNLNFARREHCNNCNMYRYGPELQGPGRSPRRGYNSSLPRSSPPRMSGPRGLVRDMDRYKSPPRSWDADSRRGVGPAYPSEHGGRFVDYMRRGRPVYADDVDIRGRGKYGWSSPEWNGRDTGRGGFVSDRRVYDRRSPSPRARWIPRERSRSPPGDRELKGSYMGRGRGREDPRYGSYYNNGRGDSSVGRGRGYHPADTFTGRGRGDRRCIARGRNDDTY